MASTTNWSMAAHTGRAPDSNIPARANLKADWLHEDLAVDRATEVLASDDRNGILGLSHRCQQSVVRCCRRMNHKGHASTPLSAGSGTQREVVVAATSP